MTRDEIIKMARQAGIPNTNVPSLAFGLVETGLELLEAFAKLVEDKVRQEIIEKNAPVIKKVNEHIQELQDAVKAEREACAKVCETAREAIWEYHEEHLKAAACNVCTNIAQTIRARSSSRGEA